MQTRTASDARRKPRRHSFVAIWQRRDASQCPQAAIDIRFSHLLPRCESQACLCSGSDTTIERQVHSQQICTTGPQPRTDPLPRPHFSHFDARPKARGRLHIIYVRRRARSACGRNRETFLPSEISRSAEDVVKMPRAACALFFSPYHHLHHGTPRDSGIN